MKEIILKVFSYSGEFNRKEYLFFGVLLPIVFVILVGVLSNFIRPMLGESTNIVSGIGFFMMLSIFISSAIKRARNIGSNIFLVMLVFFFVPPFATIYLLFASTSAKNKSDN